jgi:PAS domain S-box-containing protein
MNESESISEMAPTSGNGSVEDTQAGFRRIVDGVPGCILVAGAEGQIVYANKVAIATLGRTLEDLSGAGWLKSLDSMLIAEAEKTSQGCVQKREPLDAIWRFRQHDGTYRWHHLKAELCHAPSGSPVLTIPCIQACSEVMGRGGNGVLRPVLDSLLETPSASRAASETEMSYRALNLAIQK